MKRCLVLLAAILMGCTITGNVVLDKYQKPEVYFCPADNCGQALFNMIASSKESVHCAFYSLNLEEIISLLDQKSRFSDVKVVMDNDNYINKTFIRKDNRQGLMHNKFCVIDNKIVSTGSFNPTLNGNNKENNNLVIIHSAELAKNYEAEFQELWNGVFGKGARTENTEIMLNSTKIRNYFCPEDWCTNNVLDALSQANESIYFMTFSFTSDQIGDYLIKKHNEGVKVKGIFEKSQESQYSEYDRLKQAGIETILDKNPSLMHHKVFIIDEKIVVTGSFNPTKNAETVNDENVIIIYNKEIAGKFVSEFDKLYQEWQENQ